MKCACLCIFKIVCAFHLGARSQVWSVNSNGKRASEWRCRKQIRKVLLGRVAYCPCIVHVMCIWLLYPYLVMRWKVHRFVPSKTGSYYATGTLFYICVINVHKRVSQFCDPLIEKQELLYLHSAFKEE